MKEGEEIKNKVRKKFFVIITALLLVSVVAATIIYKSEVTTNLTGQTIKEGGGQITESEAANKLLGLLNEKYGGVEFYSSEDLGSIYLIIVEKNGERAGFFVTNDGKFYSEATYLELFDKEDYETRKN